MAEVNWFNASLILVIFFITYIGIMMSRFDKTISAVFGAVVATIAAQVLGVVVSEEELIHFGDLQIIGLIFGTLLLVDVSQDSGVFHFISVKILKLTKGQPKKLLRYFGGLTLVLSALVNNISAMMIVGSLTVIACERLEYDPKPFIVTELSMTTVGGIVTLISSVPNIIISAPTLFDISFVDFFIIGAPWALVSMIVNFAVFEWMYREEIPDIDNKEEMEERVNEFDEWSAVKSKNFFYKSVVVLTITIIGFVFSAQLGLSLAVIAIAGGVSIVMVSDKKFETVMSKLDWSLIAFFLGLFVLIATLDAVGILDFLAEVLAIILPDRGYGASIIILWVVSIISGIVDNIVVAAAFGPILKTVANGAPNIPAGLIAWATIFGANFGGGFTPIGAPSGVVGLQILKKKTGYHMGWGEFIKTQGLATFIRLVLTMGYLWILSLFVF